MSCETFTPRDRLVLPEVARPLIIEGAGGVMAPLTRKTLSIDVFARWQAPIVLCARTALGTINHTLLSIEALRRRDIPLLGVAFIARSPGPARCACLAVCPFSTL